MAMTTYWELDDRERAELTQDDVQKYLDAELMTKGVLKVRPLVLEAEPSMPEPSGKVYVVRHAGRYGREATGVGFSTPADAEAFLALKPVAISNTYFGGENVEFTKPIGDTEIAAVPVFTEEETQTLRAQLERGNSVKAANKKAGEEYERAVRAQSQALQGLWEDWTRCREEQAKLREVADTFAEYTRIAGGDETIAAGFLRKVYPAELVEQSARRFGFSPSTDAAAE